MMSDEYQPIDINELEGKMRQVTEPMFIPNPEQLELNQVPILKKMLTSIHFDYMEKETELEILKEQIIAVNCAISALEKVKLDD